MYCQNCGHQIPDNARFCDNCGAPVGQGSGPDAPSGSGSLKFQDDMVMRDGSRMPQQRAQNRQPAARKQKSSGKALFVVLCVLIVALSAGIAWEVFTLVSINQGSSDIEFPKLQTESTVTEADSGTESAL